ncbi:uncharacterized protein LOC108677509 [Hyalella azteca]|uniref:Uncharacterized protein LOC108677509 n=1 Tax=Hyalella azteca TaxID=294128 RepID=A0A8B7P598_HYAAZ|nr:uncharacterized protein LOC108677509 [Hyalella azteca]
MRELSLYLFLLAGVAGHTGAQLDFLQELQSSTGVRERVMSRLFNTDAYASFNASFKDLLASGHLSFLSVEEARALPSNLWRMYGAFSLLTLRNDTRDLVTPYLSQRVRDEMDVLRRVNVTLPQAIDRLKSLLVDVNAPRMEVALLLEMLGDSGDWTQENIINLKPILFQLPIAMLTNLRDARTIAILYEELNLCMNNSVNKSASCPSQAESRGEGTTPRAQYMLSLRAWLIEKTYGDPSNWDRDTFAKMTNLSILPDAFFLRLRPEVLLTRKDEILTMLQTKVLKLRALGRYLVERIFEAEKVRRENNDLQPLISQQEVDRIKAVISPLRTAGLMQFVYATDLPNEVLDADDRLIRNELRSFTTDALQGGSIDALVLETTIQSLFSYPQPLTSEQIRTLGMSRLALTPGRVLKRSLMNYTMDYSELKWLITAIQNTAGSTSQAKLMMIRTEVWAVGGGRLALEYIPDELLSAISMESFEDSFTSDSIEMLKRSSYDTAQTAILILNVVASDLLKLLSGNTKERIPTNNYNDRSKDALKEWALGMLPSSKLGLAMSEKAFKNGVNMNTDANAAMFLQAVDARNIPTSNIVQQLEYMKDGFPTRQACYVLKDLFVNYSATEMLTQSEEEVFQLLTPSAIERMPICVVAAFGPDRLRRLDGVSKTILLDRLVANKWMALTYSSISRAALLTIVDEGLNAKGRPSLVTGAEVNTYRGILLFFPTDLLNAVTAEAAPFALDVFNSLAASALMPCLDGGRRAAIANLITKYKGDDPQTWRNMSGLCCLLYTLPSGKLSRIPRGALMSCRCHIADRAQYAPEEEARQMECRNNLGEDYDDELWQRDNVRRVQIWATLDILDPYTIPGYNPSGRKKRAVSDVALCDRASVSGADDISNSDISAASPDDVIMCLRSLGLGQLDDTKAQLLANKVRDSLPSRSWSSLTNRQMRYMRYIMKGIPANEINELPSLSPYGDFTDTVAVLGNEKMMFSEEQLRAYAEKVLTTWRPLADMTDNQLAMFNRLLCATNASLINTLSVKRVGNALAYLGVTLEGCSREKVLAPLALKARTYYPSVLSRAQVREMGVVFAGIESDKIGGLDPSSFTGLTSTAMRAMTGDAIRAMSASQLRSLSATTAMAMNGAIRDSLSEEQKAALAEAMIGTGGASRRGLSNAAALLALLLVVMAL